MIIIKNEEQFIEWFKKHYKKLGYSKIIRNHRKIFPDFIMERNKKVVRVELETLASNFLVHKHQIKDVDEILCLIKDVKLKKPTKKINGLKFLLKDKLTISIDKYILEGYKEFCEDEGLKIGKQIEKFMLKELERGDKK